MNTGHPRCPVLRQQGEWESVAHSLSRLSGGGCVSVWYCDTPSYLFAPRTRHADIKRPYRGTPPTFFDAWIYETMEDLVLSFEPVHQDWDMEGFMQGGWVK